MSDASRWLPDEPTCLLLMCAPFSMTCTIAITWPWPSPVFGLEPGNDLAGFRAFVKPLVVRLDDEQPRGEACLLLDQSK